jgi:hypothetical protein
MIIKPYQQWRDDMLESLTKRVRSEAQREALEAKCPGPATPAATAIAPNAMATMNV